MRKWITDNCILSVFSLINNGEGDNIVIYSMSRGPNWNFKPNNDFVRRTISSPTRLCSRCSTIPGTRWSAGRRWSSVSRPAPCRRPWVALQSERGLSASLLSTGISCPLRLGSSAVSHRPLCQRGWRVGGPFLVQYRDWHPRSDKEPSRRDTVSPTFPYTLNKWVIFCTTRNIPTIVFHQWNIFMDFFWKEHLFGPQDSAEDSRFSLSPVEKAVKEDNKLVQEVADFVEDMKTMYKEQIGAHFNVLSKDGELFCFNRGVLMARSTNTPFCYEISILLSFFNTLLSWF